MGEIDFLLDAVQRRLDELRMAYKTNGASSCGDTLETFNIAQRAMQKSMNKKIEGER